MYTGFVLEIHIFKKEMFYVITDSSVLNHLPLQSEGDSVYVNILMCMQQK